MADVMKPDTRRTPASGRARKVVKQIAPPYAASEIRDLLGISDKDVKAARKWLQSTAEEPSRAPRGRTVRDKPVAAKTASKLSD